VFARSALRGINKIYDTLSQTVRMT